MEGSPHLRRVSRSLSLGRSESDEIIRNDWRLGHGSYERAVAARSQPIIGPRTGPLLGYVRRFENDIAAGNGVEDFPISYDVKP